MQRSELIGHEEKADGIGKGAKYYDDFLREKIANMPEEMQKEVIRVMNEVYEEIDALIAEGLKKEED